MGGDAADVDNGCHGFFETLNRTEFVWAVEVDATSKDVWTWETFEGELCSVSSSTDGTNLGFHSCFLDGLFCNVDDIHHWFYLLTHVVVLVLQFELCHVAIFLIDFGYGFLHALLAPLKNLAVVVSDDVGDGCFLTVAIDTREVEKAFRNLQCAQVFPFQEAKKQVLLLHVPH